MTRWRAAGIHLLISAAIAAAVLTLMLVVWYPPPLFEAMGGNNLAFILIGVHLGLGPLLTLVVFKAGKRGLKFDLGAIATFQLAALLYGCYVIYLARPAFIVFVKDQFQVVTAVELAPERLAEARHPQFRQAPGTGPVFIAGAWPSDLADQQKLVDVAFTGQDLQHFPKHYRPYSAGKQEVLAKAQTIASVRAREPAAAKVIDDWLARSGVREESIRYLRLRARHAWLAVLIDRETAEPVKMLVSEKL